MKIVRGKDMEINFCDLSERSTSKLDEQTTGNKKITPVRMAG
jgi:hypothetical protein